MHASQRVGDRLHTNSGAHPPGWCFWSASGLEHAAIVQGEEQVAVPCITYYNRDIMLGGPFWRQHLPHLHVSLWPTVHNTASPEWREEGLAGSPRCGVSYFAAWDWSPWRSNVTWTWQIGILYGASDKGESKHGPLGFWSKSFPLLKITIVLLRNGSMGLGAVWPSKPWIGVCTATICHQVFKG